MILLIPELPSTGFQDEPWLLTSSLTSDPQVDGTTHLDQREENRDPAHLDSGRA